MPTDTRDNKYFMVCYTHVYLLKAKGKHKTCNTLYFYIQCIRYSEKIPILKLNFLFVYWVIKTPMGCCGFSEKTK